MTSIIEYSIRGQGEPRIVGNPLPGNLLPSVERWIRYVFSAAGEQAGWQNSRTRTLRELERKLGVSVPLDPIAPNAAIDDLIERVRLSEEFAVHTLAILLSHEMHRGRQAELAEIFEAPGSKWEVVTFGGEYGGRGQKARITLRQNGPVPEVIAGLAEFGTPAYGHLEQAMRKLTGPSEKDPVGSYSESIKAVEAAARPVIAPNDVLATLGTMISAMRDKEAKWRVILAAEDVGDVIRRMEILWKTPHERHGSDLPQPAVTIEQAHAGFNLALSLADYFARGLISRVDAG